MDDSSRTEAWKQYHQAHKNQIMALENGWPQVRTVPIDFCTLQAFDAELAQDIVANPTISFFRCREAVKESLDPDMRDTITKFHIRILGMEKAGLAMDVRQLTKDHIGQLVAVRGIVRKVTQVRPQLLDGVFQCARCLAIIREPQLGTVYKEPLECYRDQGGCGKSAASTRFALMKGDVADRRGRMDQPKSTFIDSQKIEIQECPEGLHGGDQPERMIGYLEEDLCRQIFPGDKVILTAVLVTQPKRMGMHTNVFFEWHLDAVNVVAEERGFEDVQLTDQDEKEIQIMAKRPDIYQVLIDSVAPAIYGYEHIKEAIILQLFGGVSKTLMDGTRLRGDIHVLLCGDPAVAKSQILRRAAQLSPRGVFASGKSSSAAGLTAAAVHDDFGEGRWTLEAGALVLADRGLCAVDEIDKMNDQDRSAMHEAMEQQRVTVNKAGINATLQSRCSVLAGANPKEGRFDEHSGIADQINLAPTLLSRFDVIFVMADTVNRVWDLNVASHIIDIHHMGEEEIQRSTRKAAGERVGARITKPMEPAMDPDFMRKYVLYARSRIFPMMDKDVRDVLKQYYVGVRAEAKSLESDQGTTIPMTPRQLEAMIRLAEASARARLSDRVTIEDADRGKRIMESFLRSCAQEGGRLDIDAIMTGTTHIQRERIHLILDIIQELDEGRGVTMDEILRRTGEANLDAGKVTRDVQRLESDGRVFCPTAGKYKVIK